jgi:hypothetical protein
MPPAPDTGRLAELLVALQVGGPLSYDDRDGLALAVLRLVSALVSPPGGQQSPDPSCGRRDPP